MNNQYTTILFDLDGTLTDPQVGITKSVQYALRCMGIEEPDLAKLIHFIGPPLAESFRECYGMSNDQARQAVQYYREYFSVTGIYENGVYAGIPELLSQLVSSRKELAVATSKPQIFANQILQHFSLAEYFSVVAGSNLDGTRVEKAEVIAYNDFTHYGSEAACREAGKLRIEGKEYLVKDGDVMHFRFNV